MLQQFPSASLNQKQTCATACSTCRKCIDKALRFRSLAILLRSTGRRTRQQHYHGMLHVAATPPLEAVCSATQQPSGKANREPVDRPASAWWALITLSAGLLMKRNDQALLNH